MSRLVALVLSLVLLAPAGRAGAQIFRVPTRTNEPVVWVSAAAGLFQASVVRDGDSQSNWAFGGSSGFQYRGSLEWALRNHNSIGVSGGYVRMPFTYQSRELTPGPDQCALCDANVTITTIAATFHGGGGEGLHQVIEVQAGATWFRDFEEDRTGEPLAPLEADRDIFFSFGYGIGYQVGRRLQISIVQDFGIALHQRGGIPSGERNTPQQRVTRLMMRYGLGNKRPL